MHKIARKNIALALLPVTGLSIGMGSQSFAGTVLSGTSNSAGGTYAVVAGGQNNQAAGAQSTVSGGIYNYAGGDRSAVGGGYYNRAFGIDSVIAGGDANVTSGLYSFIGGGIGNWLTSEAYASAMCGGFYNEITGSYGTLAGGHNNVVDGLSASVLGGESNEAAGSYAAVTGGSDNRAGGDYSHAAGKNMQLSATADRTFLWGYSETPVTVNTTDAFLIYGANVGIGTLTPSSKLTVNGTIQSLSGGVRFPDGTVQTTAALVGGSFSSIYQDAQGYIGVNTTTPSSWFTVDGAISSLEGGFIFPDGTIQTTAAMCGSGFDAIFEDASDNIGIGTSSPGAKLEVFGGNLIVDNGVTSRVRFESGATLLSEIGQYNTTKMFIANKQTGPMGFETAGVERLLIDSSGRVGIGTSSPSDKLHVAGDIRVGTGTTGCIKDADGTVLAGTCSSDVRLKTNIRPFPKMIDKVSQLQPVYWDWRSDVEPDYALSGESFGLIAQEVEEVLPELVAEDANGYKAVRYHELPFVMLQSIRDLNAENEALRHEVASLGAGQAKQHRAVVAENEALRQQVQTLAAAQARQERAAAAENARLHRDLEELRAAVRALQPRR